MSGSTVLTTKLRVRLDAAELFAKWRKNMDGSVVAFPGFVSLESIPLVKGEYVEWVNVQRFRSSWELEAWRNSKERESLLAEVAPLLIQDGRQGIIEIENASDARTESVTEVFVTKVGPGMHDLYREWAFKIQQVEAKFPGYQGVYIQAPSSKENRNWITILRFDTMEHLDQWLSSKERKELIKEAESMVESLEAHQVISPFAGWFADRSAGAQAPPAWKQAMLVLLILFPIVVLELKFLNPLLGLLNPALRTFIGNTISVALITWPMMPIVLPLLRWWLYPKGESKKKKIAGGVFLLACLYLAELIVFWKFF